MNEPGGKYAWSIKVGEKGQFVIPKEARKLFDINPGDTLLVLGDAEKGIAIPPKGKIQEITEALFAEMKGETNGDSDSK